MLISQQLQPLDFLGFKGVLRTPLTAGNSWTRRQHRSQWSRNLQSYKQNNKQSLKHLPKPDTVNTCCLLLMLVASRDDALNYSLPSNDAILQKEKIVSRSRAQLQLVACQWKTDCTSHSCNSDSTLRTSGSKVK